jgi:hypothetical protein
VECFIREFINALKIKGLKVDPKCSEISIWIHNGEDIEVTHTGSKEIMKEYGNFKLHESEVMEDGTEVNRNSDNE